MAAESITFDSLDHPARLLIGGEWTAAASGKVFDVLDPGTGEVITQAPECDASDVDAAVRAARAACDDERWSGLAGAERGVVLYRVAELIEANIDQLVELESLNLGNPLPQARGMLIEAINQWRYMAGWADKIHGRTIDVGPAERRIQGYTLREPVGVVGMILPWNAPVFAASLKLAPALAAGCTCVVKPSEETPLSLLWLGRLLQAAGVPDGVVNIVTGFGVPVGAAIASHDDIDMVGFTGSTEIGRQIVAAATGNLKKLQLELGGKSPQIVLPDADLDAAIEGVSVGVFWNSGQICTAGTRLFAHEKIYDQLVEGVAAAGKALKLGYRTDPSADLGPLISQKQLDRVSGYVESGIREGGVVVTGGSRVGERGFFFEPTVVAEAEPSMQMIREEIFGPVIGAIRFSDVDEAVAMANDTAYGLAASVWSRDVSRAHRIARKVKAGRVGINVHRAGGAQLPVGGYRQSGWGRESGAEALDNYLEIKTVVSLLDR